MGYQKIINLLSNQTTHPSKFRTKTWVELNNDIIRNYSKKIP